MKLWIMKTLHLLGGRPVINSGLHSLGGRRVSLTLSHTKLLLFIDADADDDESPTAGAFTKWFYGWRK